MKPLTLLLSVWSIYLHILVHFAALSHNRASPASSGNNNNESDHLALLKFKESIISNDPNGFLTSWNSSTHFCKWHGITCSNNNNNNNPTNQRVTALILKGHHLYGPISPYAGNLSLLRTLDLGNNSFYGTIPQELGRLVQLRQLILANNSLNGEFPANLTSCSNLKIIDFGGNNLTGKIPTEIGSHHKNLRFLFLYENKLTGPIPASIWNNLSYLTGLSVGGNNLEGLIPQEICRFKMKNLMFIGVDSNNFHGTLPSCFYNLSSLHTVSAADNHFSGYLPPNMFATLPNLQEFGIGGNQFSGPIPPSITNASTLQVLDIGTNHFIGQIPNLGKLKNLWFLDLSFNYLGSNSDKDLEFLEPLANNCTTNLRVLSISYNNLGGRLSSSLGNLTSLNKLYLGYNQIYGKIPAELGNLNSLFLLGMGHNHFEGIIPTDFGKLHKIQSLSLSGNKLVGDTPAFICNLTRLFFLNLSKNVFEGTIPSCIRNLQMLQILDLSQNNLSGIIPIEVFSLPSLLSVDLSRNSFNGSLPYEVSRLKNVDVINLSENRLSNDIPVTIGECTSLQILDLNGNSFQGTIPSSLVSLKDLAYLDLSRNHLSGLIPEFLQNMSTLEYLNVSFNMLDGEVPTEGVFRNANASMVTGNGKLCGGISKLHLPPCPVMVAAKHHSFKLIVVIVCVVASLIILSLLILTIWWMRRKNKRPSYDSPTIDQLAMVSYQNLHHGTNGFSASNLIGSGSFGSVYEGTLPTSDGVVAIKVLNLQKKGAHKSFIAECNALKNTRHRNLVKIVTCCSGTDYRGEEFKALVFEYMKNGSLERWLHLRAAGDVEHPRTLDLGQRFHIIVDVASALHYLHHECEQPIIHCDLKPSNVLLDDDMVAHVGDFGLARLVSTIYGTTHHKQSSTIGVKGTVGYAPPEYGMSSEVSTHGDMYSFGILILEILTGKRPTDETFEDGQNLHNFVEISFPNNVLQILDPLLIPQDEEAGIQQEKNGNLNPNLAKFLVPLFKIGLACSLESPKERMSMGDAMKELNQIKRLFRS